MKKLKKSKLVLICVVIIAVVCGIVLFVNKNVSKDNADNSVSAGDPGDTVKVDVVPGEVDKSVYMDPTRDVEERIEALLAQMTLEEKIGQMIQPEQAAITPAQITEYGIGSVLSGGGSAPPTGYSVEAWEEHINSLKQAALDTRLGIPLIYGVDAVHGHNNVYGATMFPHNIGLGCANDEELMEEMGDIVAKEVRATGIQWTFAPTLGNARNEKWGRTYECLSEDADVVANLGGAFFRGLQGEKDENGYLSTTKILGTAKHYIGEGYTVGGANQGDVRMDEAEFESLLQDELLIPYIAAIDEGALTLMVSYNSVNGLKCHGNKYLVNDVLKGQLDFQGFVISDYNGVQQIQGGSYRNQVANAIDAGLDMFMEPNSWSSTFDAIKSLVNDGTISEERIDDSVRRILRAKFTAGLFEEEIGSAEEKALVAEFGSQEHRDVARRAVRESLVLLKNDKVGDRTAIEILKDADNMTVFGAKAYDIGVQCGGWTISWQGQSGNITPGTTIVEGIMYEAGRDATVNFNLAGNATGEEDALIVVIGETPYAESSGDRSSSTLTISTSDKELMEALQPAIADARKKGTPVIGILITGRPITIADYIDDFDAIVEAWLPGTEGAGVADVLLGDYDFTGTLQYTWPWYASDIESKFDDESLVLFKKGTGLRADGTSINPEGTVVIGEKPEKTDDELAALESGAVDLESVGYVVEAETFTEDSYLVTTGNADNISYVDGWGQEWANAKWNIKVPKAGNYKIHFKIAAAKDSNSVDIYYATPTITDDGAANRTTVPIKKTDTMLTYSDVTLDVVLEKGTYQFKLMNSVADGADFRIDSIEFEYMD